ncbi:MAG: hypothetical protein J1E84_04065 [Muribaculaceae bacterium]|nr:hypothetical protein [Muribaculaceae bacterium]
MFNFFKRKQTEPGTLPFKVDIHCHILPGVDDGSPDVETSVSLVESLQRMGLTKIIASPHVTQVTFENTPETLDNALGQLQEALKQSNTGIEVDRSAEYRIDDYFQEQLKAGNCKTLPGGYILIENSFIQEPWNLEKLVFDLKIKGYKPILAHPERYMYYHANKLARYKQLHDTETLFQVNMLSIAGGYGKAEKEVALKLLEKGYIDFIGTDLHNAQHVEILEQFLSSREYARLKPLLEKAAKNDDLFL